MKKTIIVVDRGGRGSALVYKYQKNKNVGKIIAIPGNDFIKFHQKVETYPTVKTSDVKEILKIAKEKKADLVDVAEDCAVEGGLTDLLIKNGIKAFGPTKAAGQIEWDKSWSRNFMKKIKLPIPNYKICKNQKEGIAFIKKQKESTWFVKASGLASGKGAVFAQNNQQAESAISKMSEFGNAGKTFLIEECLEGEEFSAFAVVSKNKFEIAGYAQDHKRVFDKDLGPNTGGMGCSSPPKVVTKKVEKQVEDIFKKTIKGLVSIGRPYIGILYLGAIVDKNENVKIIEFNARWGSPEAEVILPSIKNDYLSLVINTINGKIPKIKKDNYYRVVVAAASKGYPNDYSKVTGEEINGLQILLKGKTKVFGAAVKFVNSKWQADGGRLFHVLGEGKNVAQARKIAYNALSKIKIGSGQIHYRKDIGYRDLNRFSHK